VSAVEPADNFCRWSCDFVMARAVFASNLVTAPAAVLLLVHRPREGRSIFFAAFIALCIAATLLLYLCFYVELALAVLALRVVVSSGGDGIRRRPWPRSRPVLNQCEEIPR
jgi:hypothetical protein